MRTRESRRERAVEREGEKKKESDAQNRESRRGGIRHLPNASVSAGGGTG